LVVVANGGNQLRGQVEMGAGNSAGWYDLKAHFLSLPAYQGPVLFRARRLDRRGPVRFGVSAGGNSPGTRLSWTIVPAGPTANTVAGWRDVVSATWVKHAGCYGWQIDGLDFSEVVVVRVLPQHA
jgi:hypothetical protein